VKRPSALDRIPELGIEISIGRAIFGILGILGTHALAHSSSALAVAASGAGGGGGRDLSGDLKSNSENYSVIIRHYSVSIRLRETRDAFVRFRKREREREKDSKL